jgi:hypothetical protein
MEQSTKLTVQIVYQDGTGNNVEKVSKIDHVSDPTLITIYGEDGGIIVNKSDIKRIYYVRQQPTVEAPVEVDQLEVLQAEDS